MCGGDASIRIERADNGYMIDAYTPGSEGKPGKHARMVASSPEQVMTLARPHLSKIGKKGRREGRGEDAAPSVQYGKSPEKKGRKRGATKR